MKELQNACLALYKKTKAHTAKVIKLRDNKNMLKIKINFLIRLMKQKLNKQTIKIKCLMKSDLLKFQ